MKYTIIASLSARSHWYNVDCVGNWNEAWAAFSKLKKDNPTITYHII